MYDLYVIRGKFKVETKVISNGELGLLKSEFLACALEGDVEIRKGKRILTISEVAQAFCVPEPILREYINISKRWLDYNFYLHKGKWLYE